MGAPGLLESMVAEAGFRDLVTDRVTISHDIADPELEWQSWRETFTTPDGNSLDRLPEQEQQRLHDDVIAAFASFQDGDAVRVPSEAIFVTASR
jgi:hypothetical protein